jgi:hypothetical protein
MQWFRFDFLFLPNADNVTCIRNYRGEKLFRAGGDLALVPSYAVRSATWQARNIMVVMDRKDWEKEGVMWLEFDGEDEGEKEPEAEVPDRVYREWPRQRALEKPYVPGVDFVGHHMDETRRMCKIREAWEREYLLAKELMEM